MVLRRFLMTVKTNARQLHSKNAKAPRLAIEQSEREATAEAAAMEKVSWMAKAHERVV